MSVPKSMELKLNGIKSTESTQHNQFQTGDFDFNTKSARNFKTQSIEQNYIDY